MDTIAEDECPGPYMFPFPLDFVYSGGETLGGDVNGNTGFQSDQVRVIRRFVFVNKQSRSTQGIKLIALTVTAEARAMWTQKEHLGAEMKR